MVIKSASQMWPIASMRHLKNGTEAKLDLLLSNSIKQQLMIWQSEMDFWQRISQEKKVDKYYNDHHVDNAIAAAAPKMTIT